MSAHRRWLPLLTLVTGGAACVHPLARTITQMPMSPAPDARGCVVEKLDAGSGQVTDRFEFSSAGLVRSETRPEPDRQILTTYSLDGAGRILGKDILLTGLFSPRTAVPGAAPVPYTHHTTLSYHWSAAGELSEILTTSEVLSDVSPFGAYTMTTSLQYDWRGRKKQKVNLFQGSTGGSVSIYRYDYRGARLHAITSLDGGGGDQPTRWRVVFKYNLHGDRVQTAVSDSTLERYTYDDHHRLAALFPRIEPEFIWDDAGHLIEEHVLGWSYSYDASGRVTSGSNPQHNSLQFRYSEACPAGFSSPVFTPNVDGFLYYDGMVLAP